MCCLQYIIACHVGRSAMKGAGTYLARLLARPGEVNPGDYHNLNMESGGNMFQCSICQNPLPTSIFSSLMQTSYNMFVPLAVSVVP
jgi:hypothetical protein